MQQESMRRMVGTRRWKEVLLCKCKEVKEQARAGARDRTLPGKAEVWAAVEALGQGETAYVPNVAPRRPISGGPRVLS